MDERGGGSLFQTGSILLVIVEPSCNRTIALDLEHWVLDVLGHWKAMNETSLAIYFIGILTSEINLQESHA